MKFVSPIKSVAKINAIKNLLRWEGNVRDLLLFQLGITSGLRASDILRVKISDLYAEGGTIREYFEIKEKKTSKNNRITITPKTKAVLGEYAERYPEILKKPENYAFFKKKTYPLGSSSIGRKTYWLLMNRVAKDVGLEGRFGSHSPRKTLGYSLRMNGVPLEIIQHKLNHSSLAITQRYLWITMEEVEDACNKLDL